MNIPKKKNRMKGPEKRTIRRRMTYHYHFVVVIFVATFLMIHSVALTSAEEDEKTCTATATDDHEGGGCQEEAVSPPPLHSIVTDDEETVVVTNHGTALISWLRSMGGTVSPNIEIREVNGGGRLGVFAVTDLGMKDLLLEIPQDALLKAPKNPRSAANGGDGDDDSDDSENESDSAMDCGLVRTLIHEMRLGDASRYSAYVKYLLDLAPGDLPSAWSPGGKELLAEVLGHGRTAEDSSLLPPFDATGWLDYEWLQECHGTRDPLEMHAALLVIQRGWDDVLIPLYDMMSHRNGPWFNTRSSAVHGDGNDSNDGSGTTTPKPIQVRTIRPIKAGEELYTSYNMCDDCGARHETYGTPEILRDYGFVEQFPQRWFFPDQRISFQVEDLDHLPPVYQWKRKSGVNGEDIPITGLQVSWIAGLEPTDEGIVFLQGQIHRLRDLEETEFLEYDETIPRYEWDTVRTYLNATVVAMSAAVQAALGEDDEACLSTSSSSSSDQAVLCIPPSSERYDDLEWAEDPLDYNDYICDTGDAFSFPTYDYVEEVKTQYQQMTFMHDSSNRDMCFDLDGTVQICTSYRPHYHEFMVHYPARFLPTLERVVFVGGGDSMLLHEILRYPSIVKVVGLELDQVVTRSTFQHFGTQPHWDDSRVEWWFGDAAKSLLMLPSDYFGSFDMVLVDLSETVMSMTVTEGLDIFGALALLLQPRGVIVKNELYLESFSEIFPHSVQYHYYDVPLICSQAMIVGSYGNNLLKGHTATGAADSLVDNLLLYDRADYESFEIMHDYRRNVTVPSSATYCNTDSDNGDEQQQQPPTPGILVVAELEDCTGVDLAEKTLKAVVLQVLREAGLTPVQTVVTNGLVEGSSDERSIVLIVLNEGYVAVRSWPELLYVGLDVHLWASTHLQADLLRELTKALGSEDVSSFRIVAGGMMGVPGWQEDRSRRGPQSVNCDNDKGDEVEKVEEEKEAAAAIETEKLPDALATELLVQSLSAMVLTPSTQYDFGDNENEEEEYGVSVAVLCDVESEPCPAVQAVGAIKGVGSVLPLYACPGLASNNFLDLYACEKVLFGNFTNFCNDTLLRAVLLDVNAPYSMGRIVHKILSNRRNKRRFLSSDVYMGSVAGGKDEWRTHFLERFRQVLKYEPVFRSETILTSSFAEKPQLNMGILSSGDREFLLHLTAFHEYVQTTTGLVAEVRDVAGGLWNFQHDFEPTHFFGPTDYDRSAALAQHKSQNPLGRQTVMQLETQQHNKAHKQLGRYEHQRQALFRKLKEAVEHASVHFHKEVTVRVVEEGLLSGSGRLLYVLWKGGMGVILHDGAFHVDVNLFQYLDDGEDGDSGEDSDNENENNADTYPESESDSDTNNINENNLAAKFLEALLSRLPMLKLVLKDEHPRGTGKVVNFHKRPPLWAY